MVLLQAVLPGWQKPVKLMQAIIQRHMLVQGAWILDGFCGTGSMSHAAIISGMSAFAFDSNQEMAMATAHRVDQWRSMQSPDTEITNRTATATGQGTSSGNKRGLDNDMLCQEEQAEQLAIEQTQTQMEGLLEKAGEDSEDEDGEQEAAFETEAVVDKQVDESQAADDGTNEMTPEEAEEAAIEKMFAESEAANASKRAIEKEVAESEAAHASKRKAKAPKQTRSKRKEASEASGSATYTAVTE